MKSKFSLAKLIIPVVMVALLSNTAALMAQSDLIPISDVSGSSGIFVLRPGGPKKFVSRARATRTKTQRIESVKKVSRQYTTLAKVTPRRTREKTVDPRNMPSASKIKEMPRDEASKLFAGVGEYWMDRDNYNQAIELFREALTLDSTNTVAATGLSEALALAGNNLLVNDLYPGARGLFEESLKYNPKNAPAYYGLAEVLTEMDKEDEAVVNYEKALANDKDLSEIFTPLGALYYKKGDIAKADEYLTKAVAASPNEVQAVYFLGLVRYSQNRNEEAFTLLKKAASLDATNPEVFYYLGETQMRREKAKDAVEEYTKATALRANYFEAWFGLGAAQFETGNYQGAIDAYTRATRLKNDNYEAFNNLADAYRKIPDYNKAEANYNLAAMFIKRQPAYNKEDAADMYSKAAFSIAKQCELNIKQKLPCRWDAAVRALESAAELSTSGVDSANLGWAYYNAARADIVAKRPADARPKLEKAKLHLQKAANGNSNFVSGPMLNLGMALTDLGEYAAAVDVLNKVVKKEPKWAFALNELGIAYRKQDKYKDAASAFKKAVDKDKDFAQAYFNWGESEFKAGNLGEAKKAMDALRKMGRNDLAAMLDVATNGGLRAGR